MVWQTISLGIHKETRLEANHSVFRDLRPVASMISRAPRTELLAIELLAVIDPAIRLIAFSSRKARGTTFPGLPPIPSSIRYPIEPSC